MLRSRCEPDSSNGLNTGIAAFPSSMMPVG
jgi:hypothetical protein